LGRELKEDDVVNLNDHALRLGKLLANLQTLEFLLRMYLQQLPNARPVGIPEGEDIYLSAVGSELPESEITSFDSLGQLINKHNQWAKTQEETEIDRSLVEVRDALAHGRVSAPNPDESLRLLKFNRPVGGRVRVVFNEILSEEYLNRQIKHVNSAIQMLRKKIEY